MVKLREHTGDAGRDQPVAGLSGDRFAGGPPEVGREDDLVIKIAKEPWELEQVYELNYSTFVEEIPQHTPNSERRLVDRLMAESTCFICLGSTRLQGMVAICDHRPFSLDRKLPDLDSYLPARSTPCEIRLLAVREERRGGLVFARLFRELVCHSKENGYDLAVISAAASQERLYRHIGFVPFGPPLGSPEARFQGMYLTWQNLRGSALRLLERRSGAGLAADAGREGAA